MRLERRLQGKRKTRVGKCVTVGMHLVAAHVHFKSRIDARDLRSRDLFHRYGDPESAARAIRQLVPGHFGYAGTPDAQGAPHLPDRTDAHRPVRERNGRYGRTHVSNCDRDSRVKCLVTLSPANVGVGDDALLVDVEAPAHTAEHLNAALQCLRLTICYALRKNRLRLGDPQDMTSAAMKLAAMMSFFMCCGSSDAAVSSRE